MCRWSRHVGYSTRVLVAFCTHFHRAWKEFLMALFDQVDIKTGKSHWKFQISIQIGLSLVWQESSSICMQCTASIYRNVCMLVRITKKLELWHCSDVLVQFSIYLSKESLLVKQVQKYLQIQMSMLEYILTLFDLQFMFKLQGPLCQMTTFYYFLYQINLTTHFGNPMHFRLLSLFKDYTTLYILPTRCIT